MAWARAPINGSFEQSGFIAEQLEKADLAERHRALVTPLII
jgi:hypothetical protein